MRKRSARTDKCDTMLLGVTVVKTVSVLAVSETPDGVQSVISFFCRVRSQGKNDSGAPSG